MAKAFWGIDISKYSIKAARLEDQKGALAVTAIDVLTIPASPDPEKSETNVRDGLLELKKRNRIGRELVICSMPGHSTFNRIIRLPPVEPEKLPEIVNYEAQSQIPFPLDEVIWDFQPVEREYGVGEEREVMLFAVKREIVENFLTSVEPVGLNIDVVQFAPVALYNYLAFDQEVKEGAIALDLGADNTDLVLLDGTKFWIRNIPVTGNQFTKAIQNGFKVSFAEAEKLKRKASSMPPDKAQKVLEALQPVYGEVASELHRSLGYFKSISKGAKFSKLLMLGNASKAVNFQRFISQSLQMPAVRLQKLNAIAVSPRVDPAALNANLGSLGTALGLALQGAGRANNHINLLPVPFVRRKQIAKKIPFIVAAASLLLLATVVGFVKVSGRLDVLKEEAGRVEKSLKDYNDAVDKLKGVENVKPWEDKIGVLKNLFAERDLALRVMDVVNANLPDNGPGAGTDEDKKIWVLRWDFWQENVEALPKYEPPVDPAAAAGPLPAPKFFVPPPDKRLFKLELEVAIPKGNYDTSTGAAMLYWNLVNIEADSKTPEITKHNKDKESLLKIKGLKPIHEGDPPEKWGSFFEWNTFVSISPKGSRKLLLPQDSVTDKLGGTPPRELEDITEEYLIFVIRVNYVPENMIPKPPEGTPAPAAGGTPPAPTH